MKELKTKFVSGGHTVVKGFSFVGRRGKKVVFKVTGVDFNKVTLEKRNSSYRKEIFTVKRADFDSWLSDNYRESVEDAQAREIQKDLKVERDAAHEEAIAFVDEIDKRAADGTIYSYILNEISAAAENERDLNYDHRCCETNYDY